MVAPNGKPNNIIKDLIVLHNINEYQIKEANKLGGLVTPSIAIIKAGNSFTDFGSITLVGTKELINPKNRNVKVFAGDVYSPSVPRKLYYVDKRLLENITNQLIKKAYQYDDTISKSDREIYHLVYYAIGSHTSFEEDINKRSINELVDYYYDKLKIVYIIDKLIKIKVPMKAKRTFLWNNVEFTLTNEQIKRFAPILREYTTESNEKGSSGISKEITSQVYDLFLEVLENIKEKIKENYEGKGKDGDIIYKILIEDIDKSFEKYVGTRYDWNIHTQYILSKAIWGEKELDNEKLNQNIKKVFTKNVNEDYKEWLLDFISQFQGSSYFLKGNQKIPYTLDNLGDATSNKIVGQEKNMTFGVNQAKSFGTKRLNSIDEIKKNSYKIITKEEMNLIDEKNKENFINLSRSLNYEYSDTWNKLDSLGKALADYFKGVSIFSALRKNDFKLPSPYQITLFEDFANELKNSFVDYFEVKYQEAVSLKEFKYAVVPKNSSKEIIEILNQNGLVVKKYETYEDRLNVVNNLSKRDKSIKFKKGGQVEDLISKGIVELKMFNTKPQHAKEYGLHSVNPLYVQSLCITENQRLKGIGNKVLQYIDDYAIKNGHDLVFGHITQIAEFTKDNRETFFCDTDMIKNWLHSKGYAIQTHNNDFHKVINNDICYAKGGKILAYKTEKDKFNKIGITDKYVIEAINEIGLQGINFDLKSINDKIELEFEDLLKKANTNEYLISKDSSAITNIINNEINQLIKDGATDEIIDNLKLELTNPNQRKKQYIDVYAQTQKESINEWVNYLKQSNYSVAIKFLLLKAVLNFNYDYKTNDLIKRTPTTIRNFSPFDAGSLSELIKLNSDNLLEDYVKIQVDNAIKILRSKELLKTSNGGTWIKFDGGSKTSEEIKTKNAIELSKMVQNTYWCTKTNAKSQLDGGDFYIYATTLNNEVFPRIAIRMEENKVGEVRGNQSASQDLEIEMLPIAKEFLLNNLDTQSGKKWLDSIEYNNSAIELNEKLIKNGLFKNSVEKFLDLKSKEEENLLDYADRNGHIVRIEKQVRNLLLFPSKFYQEKEVVFSIKNFDNKKTKIIFDYADFENSQVTNLGNLETIGGDADFRNSKITDLGNLLTIGGDAYFDNSQITDLGNLETIGGDAYFENSQVTDLGNLQTIGGFADFVNSQITNLGNLLTIGDDAYFHYSQVTDLGNLQTIGGYAYFRNSQVTDLGNLETIGGYAYFGESIITNLGNLQTIGRGAYFGNSKITNLGNLETIGGNAYFDNSQVTDLGNLETIDGRANFGSNTELKKQWESRKNRKYDNGGGVNTNNKEDYYIFEGYDNYNNYPLYRVESNKNDIEYIGEWHLSKENAQKELDDLHAHYEHKLNLRRNERFDNGGSVNPNNYTREETCESANDFNPKIHKFISGNAHFTNSQITNLGNLETIGGRADFENSKITDLGNLQTIGGYAYFSESQITDLGNLQTIGGGADFSESQITDLGNLQTIGGGANFENSQVNDLGNLQTIGGYAYFRNSQVTDLGNLQTIGDNAYFGSNTELKKQWESRRNRKYDNGGSVETQELTNEVVDNLDKPVENTNTNWGSFFKDNPNKILGTEKEITTKYGEKVIRVIGDSQKIDEVQIPIIDSNTPIQNIETIINDNVTINNVTPIQIKKAEKLAKNSEKSLIKTKKLISENKEYELKPFDEFDAEYNVGITDDTKSAYVFYLQKISNNNLQGGFLKYDLGTTKETEKKLMNKGVLFYDLSELDERRRYVPLFLYQSGNVYKKKQKLESEKDFYIENFGEKIYEIHLEKINEFYNLIWNRRLTLDDVDEKRRLVINPTSDIATDTNIFKIQSYMAGENLRQSQQLYISTTDGKEVIKPLKDTYSGKYSNRKNIYEYSLQLAFILYLKDIGGGERAKAQGVIYTDGIDYEMIYAYYLKNSPRPKTIEKDDWAKIKGYASKNGKRLFAHFLQFGLLPADRQRLELLWNIEYNGNLEINTLKVPIGFQMARMFRAEFENKVRTEKRASVVFNMIKGSSLLAYGVGLGKTFCAIYNLAQNLEFGFCKRPLIILPNQVYPQFIKEIGGIIPQYKINELYNLKGLYSFTNQKIEDYSISVCTYEGLEEIAFSDNLDTKFFIRLGEILSGGENMSPKQKEKEAQKYFEIIGKAKSETSVDFDDLNTNWDYLVVDEAHNFKKLFTQVRGRAKTKTDAQVEAGSSNSFEKSEYQLSSGTPSLRAIRLFFITQYVQQKSFNGNVLLLTATPFTNSPLEVFTMLSFLNYDYLKLIKLGNLKNFFDNFAVVKIEVVINTKLEPVRKQVFIGWANVVGLQDLIFKFMDKATKEMEEKAVNRPNKIVLPLNKKEIDGVEYQLADSDAISTTLALTPFQLSLWDILKEYAEGEIDYEELLENKNMTTCGKIATREIVISENDEGEEEEEEVISLKLINEKEKGASIRSLQCLTYGRQLALTPYLYRFSGQQDEPTAKQYVQSSPKFLYTMSCIKSVKEYHESKGTQISGQIIFMNIGTLCFHYLAEYLVSEIGYKENEIGIISGSNNRIGKKKYTKSQVQDKYLGRFFNEETRNFEDISDSERVKVLIGSASIQEGLNLQKYSSVLYNLYIGFNPTEQIQLEGRIWRQGNKFNNVRIVIPLMENSMDIFMFQKLQEKTKRINEIWARTGKNEIDTTEFDAEELKYELITNSVTLARLSLDEDKQKIDDKINDLNYQFSTIKNISQIYKTISSFYKDGSYYSNVNINNFFELTRVGYMYAILKTYRQDLVPLPMFLDDISENGNDTNLNTLTYYFSAKGKQEKDSFSDKMLNYKVKEIIELMVQFRKESKIYVPKEYKYENFISPTFEKKDIITFNAPITTKDKKGVEKTETKKLEGVIKVINDDKNADDYLEVFVKGYEELFEIGLKDIVIVEKIKKDYYNIGTKEFTENLLPITYFGFSKNINDNSRYSDKIYDVFRGISYKDDLENLQEKQEDFIEDYKGNLDEATFWSLMESNLFDQNLRTKNTSVSYNDYIYVDVYNYSYIKEFLNVEKAEREILKPKGINNEEELSSRLEELTLDIKQKGEEKKEIDSSEYLMKKVSIIEQKKQIEKENPLRKASTFLQRAKEFQTANAEYKGNEYLDDIKIDEVKVEKTIEVNAKDIKILTIDDRIKGLKIVLKLAKGDKKTLIEKRIKGLEIAQKMKKFNGK